MYDWLLSVVACVLQTKSTALHYASINGYVAVVQTLLDAGTDVEARDNVSRTGYYMYIDTYNTCTCTCGPDM